jgi:hypothetical protein
VRVEYVCCVEVGARSWQRTVVECGDHGRDMPRSHDVARHRGSSAIQVELPPLVRKHLQSTTHDDHSQQQPQQTTHRIASHRIASHRIASHRIASHRIASHRIASHGAASLLTTFSDRAAILNW